MTTATLTDDRLSTSLRERAETTDARLRQLPYYARLLAGEVTRDEYAAWLVQLHKYVRYTESVTHQLAVASAGGDSPEEQALHAYAVHEEQEEAFHDDLLVVDLARLWGVSRVEARGRIELEETAPAILTYSRLRDVYLSRNPTAILGVAYCLETISAWHSDVIRAALHENSRIEGVRRATTFLKAHSGEIEEDHQACAAERLDAICGPRERAAAFSFGNLGLNMFEGIAFYLDQRFR